MTSSRKIEPSVRSASCLLGLLGTLAAFSLAPSVFADFVNGGFNLDIIQGNVSYQSGGATVFSTSDLVVDLIMPTDLEQDILNGELVTGLGLVPGMTLTSYVDANLALFTGVTDDYFINNAASGESGGFLNHSGVFITYSVSDPYNYGLGLISNDLEGLLPGYSVASNTVVELENDQYLADYAALQDAAPTLNINFLTATIVETAPDGGATGWLLALGVSALVLVHRKRTAGKAPLGAG